MMPRDWDMHVYTRVLTESITDMIPRDEHDARDRPQLHEHDPHGVAKGTRVVVGHAHTQRGPRLEAGLIDERGGDHVLDPRSGVTSRDADQELQTVRGHGDHCGRDQCQQGEQGFSGPVGISSAICQEERLEIVAESDGDDREIGAEGEDGEESQEHVQGEEKPGI